MNQLNTDISEVPDDKKPIAMPIFTEKQEAPLLNQVRSNFGVTGGISLIFGASFALLFYKAGIGINTLVFTMLTVGLLYVLVKQVSQQVKIGTHLYYAGAVLLGFSSALTSSGIIQLLNVVGILLLLDLSLLHQFYEDNNWDFLKHSLLMIGLFFQSIGSLGMPFVDCFKFMKQTRAFRNDKVRNIFVGILLSIPFLWIVTILLINADLLFGKMAGNVFDAIFKADIYAVLFMILFGFLACYCIICAAVSKVGVDEKKGIKKGEASIATTVMVILTCVYLIFSTIQVVYLFAGGLFVLPDGYTFAEYARRGFFELLAVAIINVSLMVLCRALFEESKLLRLVITCMTICTYIMIASATYRMLLYIGAYHLTFLRVFVLLVLLIIALILAGVIFAEYNQKFPLFRYSVVVVSVCYIAFTFTKPDYYIASYLIENTEILDYEDIIYLSNDLSLDGAPVVLPLLEDSDRWTVDSLSDEDNYDNEQYFSDISEDSIKDNYVVKLKEVLNNQEFRDFNYSIYLAGEALKEFKR